MKKFSPYQVIDLKFQIDHINPIKNQLLEEYRGKPTSFHRNARLFAIPMKHRVLKLISDGNRITEFKII